MSGNKLQTAAEWCRANNVSIVSADGWRYEGAMSNFFNKQIEECEFLTKLHQCTTKRGFEQHFEEALRAEYEISK